MIDLTIAVAAVPARLRSSASDLLDALFKQSDGKPVEVLGLIDNKQRTIGAKRNALLSLAQGRYVAFVDDDDRVAERYVDSLLGAIQKNARADCIVFDVLVCGYTPSPRICRYGVEFSHGEDAVRYYRKPNHWMCYRTELARAHRYLDINRGEDDEWAQRASGDIRTQARIDDVLYTYQFDVATTETQS